MNSQSWRLASKSCLCIYMRKITHSFSETYYSAAYIIALDPAHPFILHFISSYLTGLRLFLFLQNLMKLPRKGWLRLDGSAGRMSLFIYTHRQTNPKLEAKLSLNGQGFSNQQTTISGKIQKEQEQNVKARQNPTCEVKTIPCKLCEESLNTEAVMNQHEKQLCRITRRMDLVSCELA